MKCQKSIVRSIPYFPECLTIVFLMLVFTTMAYSQRVSSNEQRFIWFGTTLDPQTVMNESRELAEELTDSSIAQWQAKGDQHRTYRFEAAGADEPYRLCVPSSWDGTSKLPLVMFLHGAGSNENTYVDMNNKQMINLAAEHGFLLVAPLGDKGAYGNFLRLSAPFGNEQGGRDLMAQVTSSSERTNQLSEMDVMNVLEMVLHEYPVDRDALFLSGHSMGSGGTWYIGGKYSSYWRALAPMSGPFVQESGYPWDRLRTIPVFVTEGTQTPSLEGSHAVRDWMRENGFPLKYEEVNADHGGMIPLVLPHVFEFFDSCYTHPVKVAEPKTAGRFHRSGEFIAQYRSSRTLRITLPAHLNFSDATLSIIDLYGRTRCPRRRITCSAEDIGINGLTLSAGTYRVVLQSGSRKISASFVVTR
ncbi:MAG: hypothetical protein JW863_24170 [Chitinispirillaceae bacterium]|nr:hypothetical protein [Chitinispirillaceae bacterium]